MVIDQSEVEISQVIAELSNDLLEVSTSSSMVAYRCSVGDIEDEVFFPVKDP